jgi:hypothetical protein
MLKSNIFAGEFWSKHTIGFLPGEGLFQGARAPQGHAVFAGWLVMFNAVSRAVEVKKTEWSSSAKSGYQLSTTHPYDSWLVPYSYLAQEVGDVSPAMEK